MFFVFFLLLFFLVQVFDDSTDPVQYTNIIIFFLLLQRPVQVHAPEESYSIKEAKVQKIRKNKEFKGQLASHQRTKLS